LLPTALAAAGVPAPKGLDGVDLLPHLSGDGTTTIRSSHYWRVGARTALRAGEWKIYRPAAGAAWQLYHLKQDVSEQQDLAAEEPARVAEIESTWKHLDSQMAPPLWGGPGGRRP
jgi:arylsulfatase A-like enzyme